MADTLGTDSGGTLPEPPIAPQPTPFDPFKVDLADPAAQIGLQNAILQAQLGKLVAPPAAPAGPAPYNPAADQAAMQRQQAQIDAQKWLAQFGADQQAKDAAAAAQRQLELQKQQQAAQQQQQQSQQAFQGQQNDLNRQLQAAQLAEQQANNAAMAALEQGKLEESRRQFDISQQLAARRFDLEKQVAQQNYDQKNQEFAFGALKFLTDLSQNPRTALASFFLNRGQTPPDAVGQSSPIPAGLNQSNIAQTLPGFLQGIIGAARGAGTASPSAPAAATASTGSFMDAIQGAGVIPPFLQRVLAQSQGDASQGTNTPQTGAVPSGVPLVSSLALLQMSPSERESFRGIVEGSGMNWNDYLALVQRNSPQSTGQVTLPQFAFQSQ